MNRLLLYVLIVFVLFPAPVHAFEPGMDVHFIDVGQGDSIFIETPADKKILIDAGPPEASNKVVTYLKEHEVDEIDLVIATHPDKDHIGGLPAVFRNFNVRKVIETGKVHVTKTYYNYTKEMKKQEIPVQIAVEGQSIPIDPFIRIDVLNASRKMQSNNESSIALKVGYGEVDFLLLSDIEKEQEEKIRRQNDVEAEILKVAHHGSKTSTSSNFLQTVNPQVAILTYSPDNKYGHPVERVINNLNEIDALIYSTASFGDLVITTNGKSYFVMPQETPMSKLVKSS